MTNLTHIIEKYFLVWIVVFSLCGYHFPAIFKGLVAYIPLFLGIIMFGMGITLEFSDAALQSAEIFASLHIEACQEYK